ncbi:MAG: hypothetical protein KDA63_03110 [Planctomycetales bacterium]|nr:hypothetical protein [Planctomycetales bacterium]
MSNRIVVLSVTIGLVVATAQAQQPPAAANGAAPKAVPPRRQSVQVIPPQPNAPFQLSPAQQQQLDQVLAAWQVQSQNVDTLSCDFTRQEFSEVFGDVNKPKVTEGKLAYRTPDQADYQITTKGEEERWVCTGQSIFEFNYKQSQLIERPLPPELQGKAISNGPLPFLFGVDADQLRARYWMRVITPEDKAKAGEVWLEAWPKRQADAANFRLAWLILRPGDLVPVAIKVVLPNNDQTLHQFSDISVNHPWTKIFGGSLRPNTPLTWKYIREDPPPSQPAPLAQPRSPSDGQPRQAANSPTQPTTQK